MPLNCEADRSQWIIERNRFSDNSISENQPLCDWQAALTDVNGHEEFWGEIALMLAEDGPLLLENLKLAIARGDIEETHRLAHRLKGLENRRI